MKKIKITVMRKARYDDLIDKYENPIEHACGLEEGQVFFCEGWQKPDGFCDSAWDSVSPFIMTLAHGGENFYDGWMKNKKSAMISCNDGWQDACSTTKYRQKISSVHHFRYEHSIWSE